MGHEIFKESEYEKRVITTIEREEATFTEGNSNFDELGLSDKILSALAGADYLQPTPVQAGVIPSALSGRDVLGQARTGTGKTAAYALPILEKLVPARRGKRSKQRKVQALVLVPTRELAVQVSQEFLKLAKGSSLKMTPIYGGTPLRRQVTQLREGTDVVIGTPGRVIDHLERGTLWLDGLKIVVLDEADRMLDIGFRPAIEKILRRCPQSRQTLLLSATVSSSVRRLAARYMQDPEFLNFSPDDISCDSIEQFYFTVDNDRKLDLLEQLFERESPKQAIIFCRTKRGTDRVHRELSRRLDDVACIHGDLQQRVRDRVMRQFREGSIRYLVATDVVGRGIDVSGISHIINYDIPQDCDDYVHRVGRTGRMGRDGVAYTFVGPDQGNELTRIEMRIDRLLTRSEMPGFDASRVAEAVKNDGGEAGEPEPAEEPKPRRPARRKYRRAL